MSDSNYKLSNDSKTIFVWFNFKFHLFIAGLISPQKLWRKEEWTEIFKVLREKSTNLKFYVLQDNPSKVKVK